MTALQFSVFEYEEWYPTFFGLVGFVCMRTDGNQLEMWNLFGERCNKPVPGKTKSCDHWGGHIALDSCCGVEEANWAFVQGGVEVDNEPHLVELLVCMCEKADGIGDKPQMDYFVKSLQFECMWIVDYHER